MKNKMVRKMAAYVMTVGMIGGSIGFGGANRVFAATKHVPVKTAYKRMLTGKDYKKMYEDYMGQFFKVPEVTYSVFDHGYIFPRNVLNIKFTEVKYARSYEVMISKDDKFEKTKIYKTEKNTLFLNTDTDDFITPSYHGRHVKVRANYGYGIHGKWSESKMIGCGKLHLHQNY